MPLERDPVPCRQEKLFALFLGCGLERFTRAPTTASAVAQIRGGWTPNETKLLDDFKNRRPRLWERYPLLHFLAEYRDNPHLRRCSPDFIVTVAREKYQIDDDSRIREIIKKDQLYHRNMYKMGFYPPA